MRELQKIDDQELQTRLNAVKAMIRRTRKSGGDTIEAEKELCWLEREEEVRQRRATMHEEYITQIRRIHQENEAHLPDFDWKDFENEVPPEIRWS